MVVFDLVQTKTKSVYTTVRRESRDGVHEGFKVAAGSRAKL